MFGGLLAALISGLALLVGEAGRAAEVPGERESIVVEPGDTVWSVAGEHLPGLDRFVVMEEIRRINHLRGYQIESGQRLFLPIAD